MCSLSCQRRMLSLCLTLMFFARVPTLKSFLAYRPHTHLSRQKGFLEQQQHSARCLLPSHCYWFRSHHIVMCVSGV